MSRLSPFVKQLLMKFRIDITGCDKQQNCQWKYHVCDLSLYRDTLMIEFDRRFNEVKNYTRNMISTWLLIQIN